jgi:hypothetical protein
VFDFALYERGETSIPVETVSATEGISGSTHMYAGVGEYCFKVNAANVARWGIEVRQAAP